MPPLTGCTAATAAIGNGRSEPELPVGAFRTKGEKSADQSFKRLKGAVFQRTAALNEQEFLILAIQEYHPGVHEVLVEVLGLPLSDAELGILTMFRMATLRGEIEVKGPFKQALEGLLDLSAMAKR